MSRGNAFGFRQPSAQSATTPVYKIPAVLEPHRDDLERGLELIADDYTRHALYEELDELFPPHAWKKFKIRVTRESDALIERYFAGDRTIRRFRLHIVTAALLTITRDTLAPTYGLRIPRDQWPAEGVQHTSDTPPGDADLEDTGAGEQQLAGLDPATPLQFGADAGRVHLQIARHWSKQDLQLWLDITRADWAIETDIPRKAALGRGLYVLTQAIPLAIIGPASQAPRSTSGGKLPAIDPGAAGEQASPLQLQEQVDATPREAESALGTMPVSQPLPEAVDLAQPAQQPETADSSPMAALDLAYLDAGTTQLGLPVRDVDGEPPETTDTTEPLPNSTPASDLLETDDYGRHADPSLSTEPEQPGLVDGTNDPQAPTLPGQNPGTGSAGAMLHSPGASIDIPAAHEAAAPIENGQARDLAEHELHPGVHSQAEGKTPDNLVTPVAPPGSVETPAAAPMPDRADIGAIEPMTVDETPTAAPDIAQQPPEGLADSVFIELDLYEELTEAHHSLPADTAPAVSLRSALLIDAQAETATASRPTDTAGGTAALPEVDLFFSEYDPTGTAA